MNGQISLIIISYNRPADLLELLQSLRQQADQSVLREVLILNNASTVSYSSIETFIQANPALPIRYIVSDENLGVSRGRNRLMQEAVGEWLLVLDDDIIFHQPENLKRIAATFQNPLFETNNTAVVTFRVIYYSTQEVQRTAFPHKQYDLLKNKTHFLTYYFAGCAHLLKKEALAKTGFYPEDFFYGMEEYDLSYRLIREGYTLGYDGNITFEHKESPAGRQPNYEKLASQWVNKSKVAWRYLPALYYFTTALAWSFRYLTHAKGHWGTFFRSWARILRIPFTEQKSGVGTAGLAYLRQIKARLWY
ncbi:MAG: glycosyltransferase family 2 protein [Chitinophagaceae bacterium]